MEKKTTNVTYLIQLTIILVFFAILIFPGALMAIDGPDQAAANEAAAEIKPLTVETYLDGSFHSSFEAWFSGHYPLRSSVISTYKTMVYNIRNSKFSVAVFDVLQGTGATKPPTGDTPGTNTPGVLPGPLPGPGKPGGDNTDEPGVDVDPMAIYTDPNNIYAAINLRQMADTPIEPSGFKGTSAVYIGKSGYLFESTYIDEYYGFTSPYNSVTKEGIATTVERLEYIQKELKERYDITMLYVLSSSKASQYANYIPDYYINRYIAPEGYVRPVDILRPMLAESSINYLDSSVYFHEIGLLNTFPKTGIHWNDVASFEATSKLLHMYSEISGNTIRLPYAVGVNETKSPVPQGYVDAGNSDQDVFGILYNPLGDVAGKIVDEYYYSPVVKVKNENAAPINVFIQGGSFTGEIIHHINASGVANVRLVYYNGNYNHGAWGQSSPWNQGIYYWEEILDDYDMIIFEQTEQQVRSEHASGRDWYGDSLNGNIGSNAVYDSLYAFLKATE